MKTFLLLAAAGLACAVCASFAGAQPNIVFILADDLGVGDLGAYGQQTVQTPNLDRMAADGMTFSRMYSGAPVCSPSRATLMTGLHNGRHNNGNNVSLPAETATTAQVLREAGYDTGMFGKVHLGGPNALWGFDEFYGIVGGVAAWDHFRPVMDVGQADASGRINSITTVSNNGAYTDDLIAQEAGDWIESRAASGQPFYAQVNFQIPHFDLEVPDIEPYAASQPWADERKVFASMVTRMDRRIGELLDRLEDPNGDGDTSDGIDENTLVLFGSDNGTHLEGSEPSLGRGPHDPEFFDSNGLFRGWKRDLYDGGIHTPFLAQWKGTVPAGSNSDHYGDFSDFLPTAAELAGGDTPVQVDGESYAHVLTGAAPALPPVRDDLYFEFTGNWFVNGANGDVVTGSTPTPPRRALVRDGYKAIQFSGGQIELYDLANDPSESNDLAAQMPALAQAMIDEAVSQDIGQLRYAASSPAGDYFDETASWGGADEPDRRTVATVRADGADHDLFVAAAATALTVDIGGGDAASRVTLLSGRSLDAANGVRVRGAGKLRLEGADVDTKRRVELRGGGLSGRGQVVGQLVNGGVVGPDGATSTPPERQQPTTALRFDFTGVQDDAPLTATSTLDPNLSVVSGFDFGPGALPRSAGPDGFTGSDEGNEFNAGGFNTGSLASAISAGDHLTYTVQAAPGFELLVESVSFRLWRNGGNAANDYAILTSLDGFADGDELAQLNNVFSSGSASSQTFTGFYAGGQATGDPVEVRLYGWNANDGLASTHVTEVSMDATVQLSGAAEIGGGLDDLLTGEPSVEEQPYGVLVVSGDYVQTDGGRLSVDVGGVQAGFDLDQLVVSGTATLAGELEVRVADGFVAGEGDEFVVIAAGGVEGAFDSVALPQLPGGLRFAERYDADGFVLEVGGLVGDYNYDGVVDAADYTVWRDAVGQQGAGLAADGDGDGGVDGVDYLAWAFNFGRSASAAAPAVPEPAAGAAACTLLVGVVARRGRFRGRSVSRR